MVILCSILETQQNNFNATVPPSEEDRHGFSLPLNKSELIETDEELH